MASRRQTVELFASALESYCPPREAISAARMLVCDMTGITLTQLLLEPDAEAGIGDLEGIAAQLRDGRPVQYVAGFAEFCSRRFAVGEGVLIPRPETEELVLRAVSLQPQSLLDLCTGSGCIAVTAACMLPEASVMATDISAAALEYARRNAASHGAEVEFIQADIFDMPPLGCTFDVILSNPPYIPLSERESMRRNVVDHEPGEALFVGDDDPVRFYRAVAAVAQRSLAPAGTVMVEIHERFAEAVMECFAAAGFGMRQMLRDMNDKPRIVCARRA